MAGGGLVIGEAGMMQKKRGQGLGLFVS
jgi:hypothetical protein